MHTIFRSACSVKGRPLGLPRSVQCHERDTTIAVFEAKKLIFNELDRPSETDSETTRESTNTKSRALQSQQIDMLAGEETVGKQGGPLQLQSKRRSGCKHIVHVARWFFAFPIKANMLPFLLRQIVQAEPVLPCSGRETAASATWRCV